MGTESTERSSSSRTAEERISLISGRIENAGAREIIVEHDEAHTS